MYFEGKLLKKDVVPFDSSRFSPGTWGFKGCCSFCGDSRRAEYMRRSKGKWWALCRFHAQENVSVRVAKADLDAAKAILRGVQEKETK